MILPVQSSLVAIHWCLRRQAVDSERPYRSLIMQDGCGDKLGLKKKILELSSEELAMIIYD